MKKILLLIIAFLVSDITAQVTYNGPAEGSVSAGEAVNTSDFNNLKSYPPPGIDIINHFEPVIPEMYIEPGNTQIKRREFFYLNDNVDAHDSIIVFQNFDGIPVTQSYPPDPYIAVGPNNLVQVVNRRFRITDKEGNTLKEIVAEDWFSGLVANSNPFDPKVIYDHFNNRWVMVWLSHDNTAHTAYYLISVSDDEDPVGRWFNWALPANLNGSTNSNNWADYEGVGFDRHAIYFTSSQFSFSGYYQYDKIRIIDNSNLYINSLPGTVTWIDLWGFTYPHNSNNIYSIRPVRMQTDADRYYFVHVPTNGANFITLLQLSDPVINPVLTGSNIVFDFYYIPLNALQKGGPERIEGGGCHLRNEPVYKNGLIHFIHAIQNSIDDSLSSLQYLCIDPVTNELIKNIEMGDEEHFYFYPSLAVNKDNNSLFTFSRSSANEFAGAYFTVLPDSNGSPLPVQVLQEGLDYYFRDGGSGRNRWGDYSGAWLDPADSSSFWIMTEFVQARDIWGTKVGGISYVNQVPVELVSFDYTAGNENVMLRWKTATETNNRGFEIERKRLTPALKEDWKLIGFIEGSGTTTEEKSYSFNDKDISHGKYFYRLKQIDFDGSFSCSKVLNVNVSDHPEFSLEQNYPNPFNPATIIKYSVPSTETSVGTSFMKFVELKVYDILGNEVATLVNGQKPPGEYEIKFDGSNLPSGIYIYRLTAGNHTAAKKLIILK
jgi:hypothetical protein